MNIRRINLFGGPCSGKSTMALFIAWKLKSSGYETDLIQEPIKPWTYLNRTPDGFSDQQFLTATQMQNEEVALRKVKLIVTDGPFLMHCYYGWKFKRPCWEHEFNKAKEYEDKYPSLNIFLHRGSWKYSGVGRYQTEEEARIMDKEVMDLIKPHIHVYEMKGDDYSSILYLLKEKGIPCNQEVY